MPLTALLLLTPNEKLRARIDTALAEARQFQLYVASTSTQALEKINSYPPIALLLIELGVPECPGEIGIDDFLSQLRVSEQHKNLPILFVHEHYGDVRHLWENGLIDGHMDRILVPFSPVLLQEKINTLLSRPD